MDHRTMETHIHTSQRSETRGEVLAKYPDMSHASRCVHWITLSHLRTHVLTSILHTEQTPAFVDIFSGCVLPYSIFSLKCRSTQNLDQ